MFCERVGLKHFSKSTGKQMYWTLFLIKLQVSACNFVKKRLQHRCFPANFFRVFTSTYFAKHLRTAASTNLHHYRSHDDMASLIVKRIKTLCKTSVAYCWFTLQKQLFTDVLQNWCSYKFRKFYRKTPVLESLFNKVTTLLKTDFNSDVFL